MCVLELVPGVVFGEVREEYWTQLDKERRKIMEKYESTMRELRNTKVRVDVYIIYVQVL